MSDQLQRFLFDQTDVRGELVRLEQCRKDTLDRHNYPAPVARLLGEFLAAAALMSATLKFDGSLILQAKSQGEIGLIMAEINSDGALRAIAKDCEQASSDDFKALLRDGQLVITILPVVGQRYQGIVPLDGDNLAQCLEHYFDQSEQLSTRIWLASNEQRIGGLLLQELPASGDYSAEERDEQWQHLCYLAETVSEEELCDLDFEALLHRLYHQEQVRLFDIEPLRFECSCSRERSAQAIRAIGQEEARKLLSEREGIDIDCEFCHQHYHFELGDIDEIFRQDLH